MNTPNYNEVVNEIVRPFIQPLEECIHGWIILIDGQVWKRSTNGNFLFPTRKKATTAFYNCMRWRAIRVLGEASGRSNYWDRATLYWRRFKEILGNRLEIRYI